MIYTILLQKNYFVIKDLSKINLNLLIALDILLKEKHVTNAGKRLQVTQSAMSNVLKQLREMFKDELFIRGQASRLVPTPFALELEPRLSVAIEKVAHVFQEPEVFKPETAKLTFTLGLSDYTEFVFLPALVKHILDHAPGINIVVKHQTYIQNKNIFDHDDIDLAIGVYHHLPESLIAQTLYHEKLVCIGAIDNPLLTKPITAREFAEAKHLVILYHESREDTAAEHFIKKMGYEPKVVVTVPNSMPALYTLLGTDLITVGMERVAKKCSNKSILAYQPFVFDLDEIPVQMVWHTKHKNNAAHRWLRETIIDIVKNV